MKKLFILFFLFTFFMGCSTAQKVQQAVNCKYELIGVDVTDVSLSSLEADAYVTVTNSSKTTPAEMTKFVGKLYIENKPISDITFDKISIQPSSTETLTTHLTLNFSQISKNVIALVTTNSIAVNYKISGTIYFETPLGEVPLPVTFVKNKNR